MANLKVKQFIDLFNYEAGLKANRHQTFILKIVENLCPDYFFHAPASIPGTHHKGLSIIDHTLLVCNAGLKLAPVFRLEDAADEISAACMLHDLIKFGRQYDREITEIANIDGTQKKMYPRPAEEDITGTHGHQLAAAIFDLFKGDLDWRQLEIADGIRYHMGRWTKQHTDSKGIVNDCYGWERSCFTRLIHMADVTVAYGARYDECG